ncbi:hypothetical protein [Actinoplanes sp. NPDC051859]|uniref:hypothetical protein n=1 Tax=Actinoplanes sp. NPDC051859 TaxID=3363909 RepID=UPI0037A1E23D
MTGTEVRLRAALHARAAGVTAADLSPAVPPTAMPVRRRSFVGWRTGAVAVAAAVVLGVLGFVVARSGGERTEPVPNPPGVTVPSSPPTPSAPVTEPAPSPSADPSSADPSSTPSPSTGSSHTFSAGTPAAPRGPVATATAPASASPLTGTAEPVG